MKATIFRYAALMAIGIALITCSMDGNTDEEEEGDANTDITSPLITTTWPENLAMDVVINRAISVTFNESMREDTINVGTFTLMKGSSVIAGTVTYEGTTALFKPDTSLEINSAYTVKMDSEAMDLASNSMGEDKIWTFSTGSITAAGPMPVNLGTAGGFAILSKSGIDTVPNSVVTGDIGVSPAAATYLTGFSLTQDSSNMFATSTQIIGKAYASNYAVPTPTKMTTAISDMEIAYIDAAGRATPNYTELGAGNISGLTLVPGLYKWGTGLLIATDITLDGNEDDVWIFQVAGNLTVSSGARMILSGGASADNIFWQAFGAVMVNTSAHIEGIVLCQTEITLATGASINGRLLAQTAVTIDQSTVTEPAL